MPWIVDDSGIQLADNTAAPEYDLNMRNYTTSTPLPIKSMRELRQQCVGGGSTLEVVFDLRGTGLTYKTAANSAIYATNKTADVEQFAKQFGLDLNMSFCFTKNPAFKGKTPKTPFPTGDSITVREALSKFIDLTSPISKKLLTAMIPFCEAQEDKAL